MATAEQLRRRRFVKDLLEHRVEKVQISPLVSACIRPTGPGISWTEAGYARANYEGGKIVVHKIVLQAKQEPPAAGLDASHLCGSEWCCNPDHLAWETRDANIARRGCAGFVIINSVWYRLCNHGNEDTRCRVVSQAVPLEGQPAEI
jgi:hypothetical protein